jgi:hypothetical protein
MEIAANRSDQVGNFYTSVAQLLRDAGNNSRVARDSKFHRNAMAEEIVVTPNKMCNYYLEQFL